MIGRVEVLEQVGGLLLLSNTEYAATEMVVKNNRTYIHYVDIVSNILYAKLITIASQPLYHQGHFYQ